jgi:hypothetical protein
MNTCGRVEVHLHSILTKIVFPRKPLNGTLGGLDSGWGLFGEGINLLPLPGIEYDSFDTQSGINMSITVPGFQSMA